MKLEASQVRALETLLAQRENLGHVRVKKRGDSLTCYSGEAPNQQQHARLTALGRDTWGLSVPHHSGRWQQTPFIGSMQELVATLVEDFPFYLEDHLAGDNR